MIKTDQNKTFDKYFYCVFEICALHGLDIVNVGMQALNDRDGVINSLTGHFYDLCHKQRYDHLTIEKTLKFEIKL